MFFASNSVPTTMDVWQTSHLPYNPVSGDLNADRRIAAARHGRGASCLFFDGHATVVLSRNIRPDNFRDRWW
jgi:prepilin-type processing-associated H-X9-DG protein